MHYPYSNRDNACAAFYMRRRLHMTIFALGTAVDFSSLRANDGSPVWVRQRAFARS